MDEIITTGFDPYYNKYGYRWGALGGACFVSTIIAIVNSIMNSEE